MTAVPVVDDDASLMLMAAAIMAALTLAGWWHAMTRGAALYVVLLGLLSLYWTHVVVGGLLAWLLQ